MLTVIVDLYPAMILEEYQLVRIPIVSKVFEH